jgi:hypothetical protein
MFYEDDRVLFISLHQDSNYPLHSGGSDQWGMSFLPHSSPPTGEAAVDHPGGAQSCRELLPLAGLLNYVCQKSATCCLHCTVAAVFLKYDVHRAVLVADS